MLIVGLTGSIATGKSTVSRLLSSEPYNLPVIDADLLARKVVEPGTSGYRQILARFSSTTPGLIADEATGALDRAVLGRRVFGNSPESVRDRKELNKIIHPLVRGEIYRGIVRAYLSGAWAVMLDVPLLFESGLEVMCSGVVVVAAGEEAQLRRLLKRDPGLSEEDAHRRIGSQWSVAEKAQLAEHVFGAPARRASAWVIDNSGDFENLEREVRRVVVGGMVRGRVGAWRWLWGFPPLALVVGLWVMAENWWRRRAWEAKEGTAVEAGTDAANGKAKL